MSVVRPVAAPADPDAALVERFRNDLVQLADPATARVVVALSGGADSIALLLLTRAVLGSRCSAATVDHGLRPEAAAEARFAAALCAERGIAHRVLTGPLPDRIGRSGNVSTRARALRYRLLAAEVERAGADWLATAHHADDQLETTLMRLNRGAGVSGLAGIRRSGWRVIRPLLGWRRVELAAIVAAAGIEPVRDPSNLDDRFDRARLRKAIGAGGWLDPIRFGASAAALDEAEEALAWTTQDLLARRTIEEGDAIVLDRDDVPAELLRRLVRACVHRIDPLAAPDGPGLARTIAALVAGDSAMIGGVLVRPGPRWRFAAAPPRRNG